MQANPRSADLTPATRADRFHRRQHNHGTGAVYPTRANDAHVLLPVLTEQLIGVGPSAIFGLLIGLALHRLIADIPPNAGIVNPDVVVGILGVLTLGLIAVPFGQVALARHGFWLAALLWPIAILAGCVFIQGTPLAP